MEKNVTIYSDQSKVRYIANGVTTNYMVPFKFFANADGSAQLSVFTSKSDNPLTENSDYTVIGAGRDEGGEVVFTSAPEKDTEIAVIRNVPATQEITFKNEDKFPAVIYERSLDKLTAEVQEVKESLTRAIVLPPTSGQNPLDARNELLQARDEAVNSAREAEKSSKSAEESKKTAADSETAVLKAKADIFDNAGFQAVAADLTGDNKIGYVADNLDTVAGNVDKATQAAEAAGEAATRAAETAGEAQQTINATTNDGLAKIQTTVTSSISAFNKNAAEKQQAVDNAAAEAGASAGAAASSATVAQQSADNVKIYNFKNKITNCITEIPNDIKMEVKDGTLTVMAGSVVYIPNGVGVYEKKVLPRNLSLKQEYTNTDMKVFISYDLNQILVSVNDSSAETTPEFTTSYNVFYNRAENKCIFDNKDGIQTSLPIGIVNRSAEVGFTEITKVFNGFGYIGSDVFVLPGVKGLFSNGRNNDGTLKNIEFTLDKVVRTSFNYETTGQPLALNDSILQRSSVFFERPDKPIPKKDSLWLNTAENKFYWCSDVTQGWVSFGPCMIVANNLQTNSDFKIINADFKMPFRAVDYNSAPQIVYWD